MAAPAMQEPASVKEPLSFSASILVTPSDANRVSRVAVEEDEAEVHERCGDAISRSAGEGEEIDVLLRNNVGADNQVVAASGVAVPKVPFGSISSPSDCDAKISSRGEVPRAEQNNQCRLEFRSAPLRTIV